MATRRANVPQSLQDDSASSRLITPANPATNSNIRPAVPARVIYKLLFFTFLMVVAPLGSYFALHATVFRDRPTWAGAAAAIVANLVVIGYVVAAVLEDQGEGAEKGEKNDGNEKKVGKIE